ncbi:hypothetical protein EPIB1_1616 [Tritonibacter mobilis]|nr:hypothetical protein EPIB1_1616 [Tritonibacter mobilis]
MYFSAPMTGTNSFQTDILCCVTTAVSAVATVIFASHTQKNAPEARQATGAFGISC